MPGVPTSKACEACRQQKKKCDQKRPKCSRCARLQIPCIGAGQQRYFFKSERPAKKDIVFVKPKKATKLFVDEVAKLSRVPTNELTSTLNMLMSALQISDLRYSLTAIGDFLVHIPNRLGQSDVLDASVRALASAFPCQYASQPSSQALVPFIAAIRALRQAMDDEKTALTPETLCAIYLIMICQLWIGNLDDYVIPHNKMMVHILNQSKTQNWQHDFEQSLLRNLRMQMVAMAMMDPWIDMDWWFLSAADEMRKQSPPPDHPSSDKSFPSWSFNKLVELTKLLKNAVDRLDEVKLAYKLMVGDYSRLKTHLIAYTEHGGDVYFIVDSPKNIVDAGNMHRARTCAAIMLPTLMYLNFFLKGLDPQNMSLKGEAIDFARDILSLGRIVSHYRPLGASYIPVCLTCAWATVDDETVQLELEALMDVYQPDVRQRRLVDQARWVKAALSTRRSQLVAKATHFITEEESSPNADESGNWAGFGIVGSCITTYDLL